MLKILKGIPGAGESAVYDDLDHLVGTWSAQDAAEFESAAALFKKVDGEMWK